MPLTGGMEALVVLKGKIGRPELGEFVAIDAASAPAGLKGETHNPAAAV